MARNNDQPTLIKINENKCLIRGKGGRKSRAFGSTGGAIFSIITAYLTHLNYIG